MTPLSTEFSALADRATQGKCRVVAGDDYMVECTGIPAEYPHRCKGDDLGCYLALLGNRADDFGEANAAFIAFCFNHRAEIASALRAADTASMKETDSAEG